MEANERDKTKEVFDKGFLHKILHGHLLKQFKISVRFSKFYNFLTAFSKCKERKYLMFFHDKCRNSLCSCFEGPSKLNSTSNK